MTYRAHGLESNTSGAKEPALLVPQPEAAADVVTRTEDFQDCDIALAVRRALWGRVQEGPQQAL